ncbi:MAG: hypothetical protein A07HN63_02539 [uncultured archaeon A07HN63]|nr:MAG: hypothetical protein A07HN63_02539 [uncultured archaeon A07HN63]
MAFDTLTVRLLTTASHPARGENSGWRIADA